MTGFKAWSSFVTMDRIACKQVFMILRRIVQARNRRRVSEAWFKLRQHSLKNESSKMRARVLYIMGRSREEQLLLRGFQSWRQHTKWQVQCERVLGPF